MPIPQPKDNEKQADYMGRCMEFMKDEKYPQKQKVAICLNTYSNPKKKSKAADRNSIEIDFSDKIKEIKDKKAQIEAEKEIKTQPVIEQKIETPAPLPQNPVIEPAHNAVTAPAPEVKADLKIEETKVSSESTQSS